MEKYHSDVEDASPTSRQQRCRRGKMAILIRHSLVATCICLAIFVIFHQSHTTRSYIDEWRVNSRTGQDLMKDESKKVPLEAHIMSKCPDARNCLQKLILPTMVEVHEKVDFRLSYIGTVLNSSSGVECMHGPTECVGNMLLLCAANLPYPPRSAISAEETAAEAYDTTPIIRSLGFANCMISEYKRIPERSLVEECALEHGIDFKALNKCASSQSDDQDDETRHDHDHDGQPSGIALLRNSFTRSSELGVTKSCTVRLDEKVWCIRDGNKWTNCGENDERSDVSSLTGEIERLWKERN